MNDLKLKICGMKFNVAEVAALKPDYLGFIFYEGSARNYKASQRIKISKEIKKVGVFVNQSIEEIVLFVEKFNLNVIQLHGDQSSYFVASLKESMRLNNKETIKTTSMRTSDKLTDHGVEVWKVFSIKDSFNFTVLKDFENNVEMFLFDTKGKEKGGNGHVFDWSILEKYPSTKPFILSGGIGLVEISEIKKLRESGLPIYGIDVNSKFEIQPGLKDVERLKKLKEQLA